MGFNLQPSTFILPRIILSSITFFLLALAPRLLAPGDFVTVDEAYHWFERIEQFLVYVQQGNYANTNIVGHPGVTTMWLGASGLLAHQHLAHAGVIPPTDSDPLLYRTFVRAPIAIVSSLCIGIAYPLLRRLYGGRVAVLAALFWAGEPFLVAHAQLLHLDSLLTSFVTLSLLAALVATHHDGSAQAEYVNRKGRKERKDWTARQRDRHDDAHASGISVSGWLVLSAVAGGLAFLTKSPSFVLLPMVGIILLLPVLDASRNRRNSFQVRLMQSAVRLLVWIVLAMLVWAVCWPAVWVDLPGVVHRLFSQAVNDGGAPHGWGNFFMGKAVDDPGPLFYPVVLAFRLAPWTLIGCILAALIGISLNRKERKERRESRDEKEDTRHASLLVPLIFVLLFLTAMSMLPKKFDRYALPVFPMLNLIAAWGVVHTCDMVCRRIIPHPDKQGDKRSGLCPVFAPVASLRESTSVPELGIIPDTEQRGSDATMRRGAGAMERIALGILVVLIAATLLWYHPYEISYYNPLLGGGATAPAVLPVGWGEGYEQAGAFISRQPDGCERAVATWFIPVFRFAYDCPPWLVSLDEAREPGVAQYAVLYIDQLQRNNEPEATTMIQHTYTPIYTVRIHGIPYASVYKLPLPNENMVQADFGDAFRLIGYDIGTDAVQSSGTLTLTLQWEPRAPMIADYNLFVHVLDANGHLISQIDVPPGGPQMPTSSWLVHGFLSWHHPVPLPANRLTDARWFSIGIYDPRTFARLPVHTTTPQAAEAPDDGPDTLVLRLPGIE